MTDKEGVSTPSFYHSFCFTTSKPHCKINNIYQLKGLIKSATQAVSYCYSIFFFIIQRSMCSCANINKRDNDQGAIGIAYTSSR
jgi:hypothetical protein